MLVENTRAEALKAFLDGKKVMVIRQYDDGSIDAGNLEDELPEDIHYLVNVPAYVNPEFEQAVDEMERQYEAPSTELAAGEEEYTVEEESVSPPQKKPGSEELSLRL